MEEGDHERIWHHPQHPYTRTLLDAVPGRKNRGPRPSASPSFASALS
ncbi:hypothetical protein [Brenneria izadpanahii]